VVSVSTDAGALRAALLPGCAAASLRAAEAGAQAAKSLARVDTGEMRDGINAAPLPDGAARVSSPVPHSVFNEYGTSRMSAKPFMRPSMDAARAAL
jgi:HK97 gp10 family phage protein